MTLVQYAFETGPEAAAANNANTGSSAQSLGGGTSVFAAAAKGHGTFGLLVTSTAGNAAFRRYPLSVAATTFAGSIVIKTPSSAVGGNTILAQFVNAAGASRVAIYVNAAGQLVIGDTGLAHTGVLVTSVTWGDKYRVSLEVVGGSTTAAAIAARAYSGTTAWTTSAGSTVTGSNWNIADAIAGVDVGVMGFVTNAIAVGFDDIQLDDGRTTPISDFVVPNDPPAVSAGPAQSVAAGATVTLAFTASDGDGTIASRATTFDYPATGAPTITGGTGGAPTFTAGTAGSRYVVRHTATDNLGATASATTEVFVPVTGATPMRPELGDGTGTTGWTVFGGAASAGAALADESNATGVESLPVSTTEQTKRYRLRPSDVKATGTIYRTLATDTGTANATLRLYEGTTLRQAWTQALTATITTYEFTLSGATLAAIADWKNLFVELGVTT